MKINKWLTISKAGSARLTAQKPRLDIDEISINIDVSLPDELFNKPKLTASITVPDEAAVSSVVESIVFDNVKEVVERATGLEFAISVVKNKGVDDE